MMRLGPGGTLLGQNLFIYAGRKPKCGPMIKNKTKQNKNRPSVESRGPFYIGKDPDAGKD